MRTNNLEGCEETIVQQQEDFHHSLCIGTHQVHNLSRTRVVSCFVAECKCFSEHINYNCRSHLQILLVCELKCKKNILDNQHEQR